MKIMAIMIGVPGSGKTTLREKLFSGATIVCPDEHIGYTKENPWTFQAARVAWKKADKLFQDALRRKDEVVVFDATMTTPKRRAKYINFAKENNYEVLAAFCSTEESICRQRNDARPEHRRVPDHAIDDMLKRLVVPELDEGFSAIIRAENNEINISPRKYKKELLKLGIDIRTK